MVWLSILISLQLAQFPLDFEKCMINAEDFCILLILGINLSISQDIINFSHGVFYFMTMDFAHLMCRLCGHINKPVYHRYKSCTDSAILHMRWGEVAQLVERATPGEDVPCSIPAVAAHSLLVGSVSV